MYRDSIKSNFSILYFWNLSYLINVQSKKVLHREKKLLKKTKRTWSTIRDTRVGNNSTLIDLIRNVIIALKIVVNTSREGKRRSPLFFHLQNRMSDLAPERRRRSAFFVKKLYSRLSCVNTDYRRTIWFWERKNSISACSTSVLRLRLIYHIYLY